MLTIAPQALSNGPGGAAGAGRLGVHLIGLGGFGCAVAERLSNRYQGQPDAIGLQLTWVDAVLHDAYASPSGPFGLSYNEAESRFLVSDGDYAAVLSEIADGHRPAGDLPITPLEARRILEAKLPPRTGFGGQSVPSYVAATLRFPTWETRLDVGRRDAQEVDQAPAITIVVASLYGGVGVGHIKIFLERLRDRGVKNVFVFLGMPSHARLTLTLQQLPDAHSRAIGVLRGLLRPDLYTMLFLTGSGNNALVQNPRAAATEVVASSIGAWLENPSGFRTELATWLGSDLQGAGAADRISAIGAGEIVFPLDTFAQTQACEYAERALGLITEITPEQAELAARAGTAFAWADPLTHGLEPVLAAPPSRSAVARFEDEQAVSEQLRTVAAWISMVLPETEPLDPIPLRVVLEQQPAKVSTDELISINNNWARDEHREIEAHCRKARSRHVEQTVTAIHTRLHDEFGGAAGVVLGEQTAVMRRNVELFGTAASLYERTAARIRSDLDDVAEELRPIERAQEALELAAQALPQQQRIKIRGRRLAAEVDTYLDRAQDYFEAVALDGALKWLADHLERLAGACRAQIRGIASLVSELERHRQASAALRGAFESRLAHLEAQPTMRVVPNTPQGRADLLAELARAAAGDVQPQLELALLSRITVHLEVEGHETPVPVLNWPAIPGFTAAAEERVTTVSKSTGAVAANGTASVIAAAYLPRLAHTILEPQYASCTLADALAADFARGWAADAGGHADADLIRRFLDETVVSPILRAAGSTVELVDGPARLQPTTHRTVFLDGRAPRGLRCVAPQTAETMALQLHTLFHEATGMVIAGAPGRASVVTVVNRINWHRIGELRGEALLDYLGGTELPVHVDPAARRAHEIEQRAHHEGLLVGRTLDPAVLRFLDDPEALRAFLGLVAIGGMPTASGDLMDSEGEEYQLRSRVVDAHRVAAVAPPRVDDQATGGTAADLRQQRQRPTVRSAKADLGGRAGQAPRTLWGQSEPGPRHDPAVGAAP